LRYRDIDSSTLRNSWHKLSNAGDDDDTSTSPSLSPPSLQHPLLLSIHGDDNGRDNDEEDENIDACCMYAMCASETSSWRLLLLPLRDRVGDEVGDDDADDVVDVVGCERAAVRKEGRRKRRVTEVKTARMAVLVDWLG
jgi:hypothetical protein